MTEWEKFGMTEWEKFGMTEWEKFGMTNYSIFSLFLLRFCLVLFVARTACFAEETPQATTRSEEAEEAPRLARRPLAGFEQGGKAKPANLTGNFMRIQMANK